MNIANWLARLEVLCITTCVDEYLLQRWRPVDGRNMPLRKRTYTSDLLTNQQGEVLKVGFLRKKGHVRRNWLDRWFVLTTEGVYYYKKRDVSHTGLGFSYKVKLLY